MWDGDDISCAHGYPQGMFNTCGAPYQGFALKSVFVRAPEGRNMGAEAMLTPSHLPCACSALACSPHRIPWKCSLGIQCAACGGRRHSCGVGRVECAPMDKLAPQWWSARSSYAGLYYAWGGGSGWWLNIFGHVLGWDAHGTHWRIGSVYADVC